ncbi:MAG: alanine racemase [Rhodospirillaceae bacterium]|nr:MAG: alanine racemase [Rhodospirillaceae bacterium]
MPTERHTSAILSIDLAAVADNWGRLAVSCGGPDRCTAVVKADAYGLGAARVAPVLFAAGCRTFFVAHLEEGLALRKMLPRKAVIAVFNGPLSGTEADFTVHDLIPVLNCPDQINRWSAHARARWHRTGSGPLPAMLHVDTGMARLGLTAREVHAFQNHPPPGIALTLIMSHLACADTPAHPLNETQAQAFAAVTACFPGLRNSLANSSGIFLGSRWHGDLVRPGAALYGINPTSGRPNPMRPVIRLQARVIQVRDVDSPETVGYSATYRVINKGRIATVAVGYADGFLRALSNRGSGRVGSVRVPLVGRVSMDLATFDVSVLPEDMVRPGSLIELIGPDHTVDDMAAEAGTIGYEILTVLGRRYDRSYDTSHLFEP